MSEPFLSLDDFEALVDSGEYPAGFLTTKGGPKMVPLHEVVTGMEPLTAQDMTVLAEHMESGHPYGTAVTGGIRPDIKIRYSHHQTAQLLAKGMEPAEVALITGYNPNYITLLKSAPAFANLVEHYAREAAEVWKDHVEMASSVATDILEEIRDRLETKPESITNAQLTETYKAVADRGGLAPTQKTHNVNVNVNLGDRLRAARERANAQLIEGTAKAVT